MVVINYEGNGWASINIDPAIDGTQYMTAYLPNTGIKLIAAKPEYGNMVRIYFNDNEKINLHYGVGVTINDVICTSNQMIIDEILKMCVQSTLNVVT